MTPYPKASTLLSAQAEHALESESRVSPLDSHRHPEMIELVMRAIISGAGRGSRLMPTTADSLKCKVSGVSTGRWKLSRRPPVTCARNMVSTRTAVTARILAIASSGRCRLQFVVFPDTLEDAHHAPSHPA